MKVTDKQLAAVLWQLCQGAQKGNELQERVAVFVNYLGQNSLIHRSGKIQQALLDVELQKEGKQKVTVESPFDLNDEIVRGILEKLDIKKPVITQKKNKQLIGGVIAKTEDTIYDISLKTQLNKLEKQLSTL